MQRAQVIQTLKTTEAELRRQGVASLYLFGSHSRDEAGSDSDIDVFVVPGSDEGFGFLEFMGAYQTLRTRFGPDVEIGYSTRDGLSKHIRTAVEKEAIRIF